MIDIEHQLAVNEMVGEVRAALDENEQVKQSLLSDLASALGTFANVIQVAGWVVPFASTAAGIIKALIGQQTTADPALQAIQEELTRLIADVHSFADHVDMEDITARLNDVQATLDLLKLHGRTDPNVQPKMPHDAITLLRDFGSREFWTRPFFADLVHHEPAPGWITTNPPLEPGNEFVLDPILIMAGYLRSIHMWLCTLALMDPAGEPQELGLDIGGGIAGVHDGVIDKLQAYHDQIVAGIRMGRTPTPDDVATFNGTPGFGAWTTSGGTVGAVDVYTNTPLLTAFWPWPDDIFSWKDEDIARFRTNFDQFQVQFSLGGKARQKTLYITEGYGDLWAILQHVRQIGHQPFETTDRAPCWSLRELFTAVSPVLAPTSGPRIPAILILRGLDSVAHRAPPLPGESRTESVREAIRAATP